MIMLQMDYVVKLVEKLLMEKNLGFQENAIIVVVKFLKNQTKLKEISKEVVMQLNNLKNMVYHLY